MSGVVPFLKWAGGKRWLVARYPHFFKVPFDRYVEPFLGGGAAFFALNPREALLSDLNSELIATYSAIKEDWSGVFQKLRAHQGKHLGDSEYYYNVRESAPRKETSRAAKFIYLNRTCFNGLYRVNLRGEFNVPKGTKDSVVMDTDDFEAVADVLQSVTLQVADFETTLDKCGEGDFAFVDPPYTVLHNYNGFLKYNEKIFSWEDQRRLHACLKRFAQRGGVALVTNAAHSSIRELYDDLGEMHVVTRHSVLASDRERRSEIEELAICIGYEAGPLSCSVPAVHYDGCLVEEKVLES